MKPTLMRLTDYVLANIERHIEEALNSEMTLSNVVATYKRKDDSLIVQVPDSYNEDDLKKYLDDRCLQNMPSDEKSSKELFGDNVNNITDAYFEYDKLSIPQDSTIEPDLEWDKRYDTRNDKEVNLMTYSLDGFKYVLTFDEFELKEIDEKETQSIMDAIFKGAESTNNHPWEFEIIFDNVEFDK